MTPLQYLEKGENVHNRDKSVPIESALDIENKQRRIREFKKVLRQKHSDSDSSGSDSDSDRKHKTQISNSNNNILKDFSSSKPLNNENRLSDGYGVKNTGEDDEDTEEEDDFESKFINFVFFVDNERKHMQRSQFTIFPESTFKTYWDMAGFVFIVF